MEKVICRQWRQGGSVVQQQTQIQKDGRIFMRLKKRAIAK